MSANYSRSRNLCRRHSRLRSVHAFVLDVGCQKVRGSGGDATRSAVAEAFMRARMALNFHELLTNLSLKRSCRQHRRHHRRKLPPPSSPPPPPSVSSLSHSLSLIIVFFGAVVVIPAVVVLVFFVVSVRISSLSSSSSSSS